MESNFIDEAKVWIASLILQFQIKNVILILIFKNKLKSIGNILKKRLSTIFLNSSSRIYQISALELYDFCYLSSLFDCFGHNKTVAPDSYRDVAKPLPHRGCVEKRKFLLLFEIQILAMTIEALPQRLSAFRGSVEKRKFYCNMIFICAPCDFPPIGESAPCG